MNFIVDGFDWDIGNIEKCQKHGVAREDIEFAFHSKPLIAPDNKHSTSEKRYIAIGKANNNRPMFIAFTIRNKSDSILIRPISARYMHAKEIKAYEKSS